MAADSLALKQDVAYLASDELEGRGTGTSGNYAAARYLQQRYRALELEPIATVDAVSCAIGKDSADALRRNIESRSGSGTGVTPHARPCEKHFFQKFTPSSQVLAHSSLVRFLGTQNVVALLPGTDRELRDQYIVIGAHFDHLGRLTFGALDPGAGDAIRNGADDNASGTAAVLELARLLSRRPLKRSVIFANFTGEELGLLGSQFFVEHSPVPLEKIVAMLNFDMVGRLRDDKLIVYGTETAKELSDILESSNTTPVLKVRAVPGGSGPSDHSSFYNKNIPVLHFFTDLHDDYHRATDDAQLINAAGMARVVDFAERVSRRIGDRPSPLSIVRHAAPPPIARASSGSRPYLGTVPDMATVDAGGLRISGVTPGSPGDKAGMRAGDVIVQLDGKTVTDLETYAQALYARKAGDAIAIVVVRAGERVTVNAILGKRE
ncbi:MAG: M28 family peptidase [Anaerolineae bacterium]|nr:M28 family peptidase [Gemmatimonadaceae bacterium]